MTYQINIEQPDELIAYLRDAGHITPAEKPSLRVLSGGVSNRVVHVERENGELWVLKQALEKLRTSIEWYSSPVRVHREAEGMRWLAKLAPPGTITPLIFEDEQNHIIAMEAVPLPHENWKDALLDGRLDGRHIEMFGRLLGTVHRRAYEQRHRVAPAFIDRSFFDTLRLEPYYSYTAEQVPPTENFFAELIDETRANHLTLVHGDYSPKNILVYFNRLILLDHEVVHFGDPAFDLGFSLTHLLSKAHHLPDHRDTFAGAALRYWQVYYETLGDVAWTDRLEPRAVRHTLGCLLARVAGRSQLEYLGETEKNVQKATTVLLMQAPPSTITDLVNRFTEAL